MEHKQVLPYVTGAGIKTHPSPSPPKIWAGLLWLSFLSSVNGRASCMLSHYLTKTVYLFVDTFTLPERFSAGSHNTNTRANVKDSVVHGPE